jgi:hypothetical protein
MRKLNQVWHSVNTSITATWRGVRRMENKANLQLDARTALDTMCDRNTLPLCNNCCYWQVWCTPGTLKLV